MKELPGKELNHNPTRLKGGIQSAFLPKLAFPQYSVCTAFEGQSGSPQFQNKPFLEKPFCADDSAVKTAHSFCFGIYGTEVADWLSLTMGHLARPVIMKRSSSRPGCQLTCCKGFCDAVLDAGNKTENFIDGRENLTRPVESRGD